MAVVEIEAGERSSDHIDDAFDRRLQFVVAGAWVAVGGGIEPRGITDNGAPRIAECANRIFASDALSRLTEAFGEEFPTPQTEAANQVVVAVDMAIERRLLHAERIGDPGEREASSPSASTRRAASSMTCVGSRVGRLMRRLRPGAR